MAISKECLAYCKKKIVNFFNIDKKGFKRLTDKAIKYNKEIENRENLVNCKYKINGEFTPAKINFKTGIIYGLKGDVLRKCIVQEVKNNDDKRIN